MTDAKNYDVTEIQVMTSAVNCEHVGLQIEKEKGDDCGQLKFIDGQKCAYQMLFYVRTFWDSMCISISPSLPSFL